MKDARHRWRAVALACALGLAPGAGAVDTATSEPFLGGFLMDTRVVYPLRVGAWEAVGEHLFDAAELGASVRYQSDLDRERWIDIFFYPVGVVPESHLDSAMRATIRELQGAVGAPGGYDAAEFGEVHAFRVPPPTGGDAGLPVRSVDMALARDGVDYHSAMVLLVDRMYFVKGRFSVAVPGMERGTARETLEAFVAELAAGTYIGSTGRCWSPAPIEALTPGAPPPDDARLASGSGDGGRYPGCVGAEPHNPDVSEGHREIRFEYRAPGETRRDGGRRLAPVRSGVG